MKTIKIELEPLLIEVPDDYGDSAIQFEILNKIDEAREREEIRMFGYDEVK